VTIIIFGTTKLTVDNKINKTNSNNITTVTYARNRKLSWISHYV